MKYLVTTDALEDLAEIVRYTSDNWGNDAVEKYVGELKNKLDSISRGEVVKKVAFDLFPNLYVTRFRYHLIYYLAEVGQRVRIVRVIHQRRDIVNQLEKTLLKLYWERGDEPIDL